MTETVRAGFLNDAPTWFEAIDCTYCTDWGGDSTMYSMVLVASLATAGDAPEFGKKNSGGAGCTGAVVSAPAGCTGVVVESAGCNGGGRQGLFGRHKNKGGCTGEVAGCTGVVVAAPAGCAGTAPAGCTGGGREGLFARMKAKKESRGAGCSGMTVTAAPCGCCGTAVMGAEAMPKTDVPKDMGKTDAKPKQ